MKKSRRRRNNLSECESTADATYGKQPDLLKVQQHVNISRRIHRNSASAASILETSPWACIVWRESLNLASVERETENTSGNFRINQRALNIAPPLRDVSTVWFNHYLSPIFENDWSSVIFLESSFVYYIISRNLLMISSLCSQMSDIIVRKY